jgi:hypothetical protein
MPADVFLISPDGNTTLTFKAAKVAQRIQRDVKVNPIPAPSGVGRAIKVDLNKYIKQFTITASITSSGVLDKTQYEAIENAAQTWSTQSDNEGLTLFRYSTRDGGGNKDFRVVWLSVDMLEDVETAPQVYTATIIVQEAHVRGGTYSISGA